jgi:hypothetical protein
VDKHLRLIRSLGPIEARKRVRQPRAPQFKMPFDAEKWEVASKFQLRREYPAPKIDNLARLAA